MAARLRARMGKLCFSPTPISVHCGGKRPRTALLSPAVQRAPRARWTASQAPAPAQLLREAAGAGRPHEPVLLEPILSHFRGEELGLFVDCTVGAGGHAGAILSACGVGRYVGVDRDEAALRLAGFALGGFAQAELVHADFRDVGDVLARAGVAAGAVDGALLDLGVSSMQLDDAARGFSFLRDGPLDMRMDRGGGGRTAADIVNGTPEPELAKLLRDFADDPRARVHAARIAHARRAAPIATTAQLVSALAAPGEGRGRTHPATLPFQALRIAVNAEIDAVAQALPAVIAMLRPGGTACVISFHSIEDRVVKNAFRDAEVVGGVDVLTRKPIVAGREEVKRNPRSRSAKLRIVRKLAEGEAPKRFKKNKYK